jgi:hypothetical protein
MQKSIQPYSTFGQKSRNQLLTAFHCGRRILQNCEDLAIELVPDFREGLMERVVGVRNPDGSIEVRRDRRGELSPYQVWVLRQMVALWRKHKGNPETVYDRALSKAKKLSRSNFDDQ